MKKNVKITVETELKNLLYKTDNMSLFRLNNSIHLFGYQDFTINEIFEIIVWSLKNKINDVDFWNIKLTSIDKQNAKPINIIYWLTGDDKVWKNNNSIWKNDWTEMSFIFLDHFEESILKLLKGSKTIGELKDRIINNISCEDFYEMGLKLDLTNKDETLL